VEAPSVRECADGGFKPRAVVDTVMSVSSPCEICATADVRHTCDQCGRLVCDRHFDDDTGFCVECAAALGRDERSPDGTQDTAPDGVDTYRF
jgi:hypothetical protein